MPRPLQRANVVWVRVEHPSGARYRIRLARSARGFLKALRVRRAELSVSLVGASAIRRLNRVWRGKDRPTDVLSFPLGPSPAARGAPVLLGDIVLSLDAAVERAGGRRGSVGQELDRYLAHGILHLMGHDHHRPEESRRMARWEKRLLGVGGLVAQLGTRELDSGPRVAES